jgi:hypothetical protein
MIKRLLLLTALLALIIPAHAQARRRALNPGLQPASACPPALLVSDAFAFDVDLDGGYVYFSDDSGGVYRFLKGTSSLEQIALLPELPVLFVFDSTYIYVLTTEDTGNFGSVWKIAKDGSTGALLTSGILTPFDLAIDSTSIYWVSLGTPSGSSFLADGKVQRIGKDGTGGKTLAQNLNTPAAVISDGTNVYFTEAGQSSASTSSGLRSVPVGGGTVTKLTDNRPAVVVADAGTNLVYSTLDTSNSGTIQRIAKSGGNSTTLTNADFVLKFVVDGNQLYYFDSGTTTDKIRKIPLAGGTPSVVVDNVFNTQEFALDDCSIYWVDSSGNLQRSPK